MWIRIQLKRKEILFAGLFYGKQETLHQTKNLKSQSDICINILGDFNVKVGNGEQGISNEHTIITPNGKRLINQTNNFNLKTLNKSPKCKGKWTRINTKNEKEKSIIDYALCTQALYTNLNTITIDEEKNQKRYGRSKKTDHNSIIIKTNKSTRW